MSNLKIQLAQINPTIGDLSANCEKILHEFKKATEHQCDLIVFPEMALCGYPCEDLWQKKYFISEIEKKILEIRKVSQSSKCAILLGAPTLTFNRNKKEIIQNSAYLIENGEVKKIINKKTLPNNGVFDENRYFEASNTLSLIEFRGLTLAILICEDLWDTKNIFLLQEQIFDAAIAINASPYSTKKHEYRKKTAQNFTKTLNKPLVYVNQVGGQDFLVFDGSSFVMDSQSQNVLQLNGFCEDGAIIEINKEGEIKSPIAEILPSEEERDYSACVLGLRDYIHKNNFKNVLLGMSGGIDSALVATMAVDALGPENVTLYALPSRFNSETSMIDAKTCGHNLDLELKIISIESTFDTMLYTLGEISDLAKENLQSRIRGNILMAHSNNSGALLLATGNKSELACGYATLYGDMCGAFNPIKDLYKTRVYELANWRNENVPDISVFPHKHLIPKNIITKAPTAELRPNQKDSDSLPEYEVLDKVLFYLIEEKRSVVEIISFGFEQKLVEKIANLFYRSEYKRRQSCLGPKISDMSFDRDRRYPVTNKFTV
ncbi:MAG: NAD+ synthase [Pseudomonadota bacterium]